MSNFPELEELIDELPHSDNPRYKVSRIIKLFYDIVNERAEEEIMKTFTIEGAHHRALEKTFPEFMKELAR